MDLNLELVHRILEKLWPGTWSWLIEFWKICGPKLGGGSEDFGKLVDWNLELVHRILENLWTGTWRWLRIFWKICGPELGAGS